MFAMTTTPALMWFSEMFNLALSPISYIPQLLIRKSLALCNQLRRVWTTLDSADGFTPRLLGMENLRMAITQDIIEES